VGEHAFVGGGLPKLRVIVDRILAVVVQKLRRRRRGNAGRHPHERNDKSLESRIAFHVSSLHSHLVITFPKDVQALATAKHLQKWHGTQPMLSIFPKSGVFVNIVFA
jgi:hypothetical protein